MEGLPGIGAASAGANNNRLAIAAASGDGVHIAARDLVNPVNQKPSPLSLISATSAASSGRNEAAAEATSSAVAANALVVPIPSIIKSEKLEDDEEEETTSGGHMTYTNPGTNSGSYGENCSLSPQEMLEEQESEMHVHHSSTEYQPAVQDTGEMTLDIECGENKAILYINKLCQGSKGKSIFFKDQWLTPNEFQYISGRETAKDWKRSIRHRGKCLKVLMNRGMLSAHPVICDCSSCRTSTPMQNRKHLCEKRSNGLPTMVPSKRSHQPSGQEEIDLSYSKPVHMGMVMKRYDNGLPHELMMDKINICKRQRSSSPCGTEEEENGRSFVADEENFEQQQQRIYEWAQSPQPQEIAQQDKEPTTPAPGSQALQQQQQHQHQHQHQHQQLMQQQQQQQQNKSANKPARKQSYPQHHPSNGEEGVHKMLPQIALSSRLNHTYLKQSSGSSSRYSSDFNSHQPYGGGGQHASSPGIGGIKGRGRHNVYIELKSRREQPEEYGGPPPQPRPARTVSQEAAALAAWDVDDVCAFVQSLSGCESYVEVFRGHGIDGETLPLLTEDHLLNTLGLKLGPALKIRLHVNKRMGSCCPYCFSQTEELL